MLKNSEMYLVTSFTELVDFLSHKGSYEFGPPRPDLILMDVSMSDTEGVKILQSVKEDMNFKTIPIIVFNESSDPNNIRRVYEVGGNSYIVKPTDFKSLVEVVKSLENYWKDIGQVYRPLN